MFEFKKYLEDKMQINHTTLLYILFIKERTTVNINNVQMLLNVFYEKRNKK